MKTLKFELRLSGYPDITIKNFKTYLDRPDDFEFNNGKTLRFRYYFHKFKEGGK
jgi:hypothetical protein